MAKITWTFRNEEGTNLNRYIATNVSTGEKITFDLLRGGNISVVGTPLNAENLNALITSINACYDLISSSEKDTTYTLSKNGNAIRLTSSSGAINDVTLNKSDVGLPNVDNTSDMDKPISTATQNALNNKVPITRKINGYSLNADVTLNKSDVGLGNVDNTSDKDKPISNATKNALDLKANKSDVYTKSETYSKSETDTRIAEKLDEKQTTECNCSHKVEITGFGEEDCNLVIDDQDVIISKIQGQTRRKSLNLLNIEDVNETTINGITYNVKNGVITLNGTSTKSGTIELVIPIKVNLSGENNTFYFVGNSGTRNGNVGCYLFNNIGSWTFDTWNFNSYTSTYNGSLSKFGLWITQGCSFNNYKIYPMLTSGTTKLNYFEPYDNTLVNSKCDFVSIGRNLLDFSSIVKSGWYGRFANVTLVKGQTYTVDYGYNVTHDSNLIFNNIELFEWSNNFRTKTFTYNGETKTDYFYVCYPNENLDITTLSKMMLYVGDTALPYEPYVEDTMKCGIELGAFDYHDNINHITHRQTSEKWTWIPSQSIANGAAYTYGYRLDIKTFNDTNMGETKGISNWEYNFNMIANPNDNNANSICIFNKILYVFVNGATNEQEARNVLDNNPPSLVYKLATETTEENILPSGYKVWYKGMQVQKTETIPYILTKQYAISLSSQVLNNVSIDRSQQKQIDELKENKANSSDLGGFKFKKNGNVNTMYDESDLPLISNYDEENSTPATVVGNIDAGLLLCGAQARPKFTDGFTTSEIALSTDLDDIILRLDDLGFKRGVASLSGIDATTNTLKKQGKYCIFNLVIAGFSFTKGSDATFTITIPEGFRPKEKTKITATYQAYNSLLGTVPTYSTYELDTNGVMSFKFSTSEPTTINYYYFTFLNVGWEIA